MIDAGLLISTATGTFSYAGRLASAALQRIGFALLLLLGGDFAAAQPYPSRPIRIVVPLPPGANGDLMPRILAQHLSAKFGQPVVID